MFSDSCGRSQLYSDNHCFAHYRQYLNFCGFNLSASQSGQKHSGYRLSKPAHA
ncbi:hypothetical protein GQT40_003900 [Salmonella enterica]|nr:hypothetical protein [Salmonella enterica]EEH0715286.1 hypothetical protein [Salmonella enterica]